MSSIKSTQILTIEGADKTITKSLVPLSSTHPTSIANVLGQIPAAVDIVCCVALYVKIAGYAGPLFNLRSTDSGDTVDIYDISEAISFLSGGEGTITAWYDQTGNSNHFSLVSAPSQPVIQFSNATTGLPTLLFSTDRALTGTLSISSGDFGVVYHLVPTESAGAARCIASDSANWLMGPYSGTLNMYAGGFAGGSSVSVGYSLIHSGYKSAAGNNFHRINGASAGGSAGASYPAQFNLGRDNIFNEAARSAISEVTILNVSALDRISFIETSIAQRYPITALS